MNYQETIDYLFSQLPMFQKVGNSAFKKDLSNTLAISEVLKHPENQFKSIHIAGTNGKGSVSHALASILYEAGYKVGLYTSPHLLDFRERIRINGKMISEAAVIEFVEKHKSIFSKIRPSFFEWTVGLAFDHFANEKVDIAIIETGLGGRLDSTNIITPILSVITNISFDHQALLGDTLEKIAFEKAGIIKPNVPVVVGEKSNVEDVFINQANQKKSNLYFAEDDELENYTFQLKGKYQKANLKTILSAVKIIQKNYIITAEQIQKGLNRIIENTGLRGRWEILSEKPLTICDTGHNEAGIKNIVEQIAELEFEQLHFVIAVVNDKDLTKIIDVLPQKAHYYVSEAKIPRALAKEKLSEILLQSKLKNTTYPTIKEAIKSAQKHAQQNDLIFIGGSTFTVAEALEIF